MHIYMYVYQFIYLSRALVRFRFPEAPGVGAMQQKEWCLNQWRSGHAPEYFRFDHTLINIEPSAQSNVNCSVDLAYLDHGQLANPKHVGAKSC